MEFYGIEYLKNLLNYKKNRVDLRYKYYDMKNITMDFRISTPPELKWFQSSLGWCSKSVDALSDRLAIRDIRNDDFDLKNIFDMNNSDIFFDSAILSALVSSCAFVYVSADENGFPRLQVIDGGNATGIVDPITNFLREGYAVLDRDKDGNAVLEAYFVPGRTDIYQDGKLVDVFEHKSNYPMLVPIIYRPDAKRPFGRSRITRACMDIQGGAIRTIKRSEIGAEFFAYPQKYITGLAEDFDLDKWQVTMSSLLALTKDDEGDRPSVGQFQMQSMSPHLDQLKMFASLFAGETGLTLDDLGFANSNPSSADAIKSQHETLRHIARKSQSNFSIGFKNVGLVAASLRDSKAYKRDAIYETKIAWQPVFEPDGTSLGSIGDALLKIQQAKPNYLTDEKIFDLLGV